MFLLALSLFFENIYYTSFHQRQDCKKDVLKLVFVMFSVFANVFCSEQFEDIAKKLLGSVVVVVPVAGFPGFRRKRPEATRRCTWRPTGATLRLRSSCCPKVPRWTPRTSLARGLKSAKHVSEIPSPTWGTSKKFFGLEILRKKNQQMFGKNAKHVGINDDNITTCQSMINQCIWKNVLILPLLVGPQIAF